MSSNEKLAQAVMDCVGEICDSQDHIKTTLLLAKKLFFVIDSDKSGTIERKELRALLKAGVFDKADVELLKSKDEDKSGSLDFGEFLVFFFEVFASD